MLTKPLRQFKSLIKLLCCSPPRGIRAGKGVIIERPRHRISAHSHITIGDRTTIGSNPLIEPILKYAGIHYNPEISIGKDVYIGPNVYLASISSISIGDGCVLSAST
jgi:acetyltransferase-like isoleucine patch superfamily enzyme